MSRKGKESLNTEQFGEDKKRKISEIHVIVTGLRDEIKALKKELKALFLKVPKSHFRKNEIN